MKPRENLVYFVCRGVGVLFFVITVYIVFVVVKFA